jgi:hypothetical protein
MLPTFAERVSSVHDVPSLLNLLIEQSQPVTILSASRNGRGMMRYEHGKITAAIVVGKMHVDGLPAVRELMSFQQANFLVMPPDEAWILDGCERLDLDLTSAAQLQSGLNSNQRELLEVVGRLRDAETFYEAQPVLDHEWVGAREKNLRAEAQYFADPSRDKEDFGRANPAFAADNNAPFKPFMELDQPDLALELPGQEERARAPNAVPRNTVMDGDYVPLVPPPSDMPIVKKGDKPRGLIGRMRRAVVANIPHVERNNRKVVPAEAIILPLSIMGLSLALFMLPAYVKMMMGGGSEKDVAAQMAYAAGEEMDGQAPYIHDEPSQLPASATNTTAPPVGSTSADQRGTAPAITASPSEMRAILRGARQASAHGGNDRAIALYRAYLRKNPMAFGVRLEFIKYLLTYNNNTEARQMCLDGMKQRGISTEQRAQLWQLMRQCLSG